ncbi:MAG: hypothetical protein RL261_1470 [Pseudomonadota bacterium]|jgi:hypothetical protein
MRLQLRAWGLAAATAAIYLAAQTAQAQAWLPPKDSFSASMTYDNVLNLEHYLPNGDTVDAGHTRTHAYGLTLAYSPTDRLMITAGLPYVVTKYWGERPHPTEVDDGHEHSTFTDLRVSLHYQLLERPVALAPYVAFITPVTDYETLGHAAPGRGLNEVWVGFGIGKNLDEWLPRTYVQGRANYSFVEEVANVAHDRSNFDLEVGYFINPRWSVRALGFWQVAHGGVDVPMPPSNPLYPYHDQLAAESFTNVGVGAAVAASPQISMYATFLTSLSGRNGHKLNQGVTVGLSYGLAPQR